MTAFCILGFPVSASSPSSRVTVGIRLLGLPKLSKSQSRSESSEYVQSLSPAPGGGASPKTKGGKLRRAKAILCYLIAYVFCEEFNVWQFARSGGGGPSHLCRLFTLLIMLIPTLFFLLDFATSNHGSVDASSTFSGLG